MSRRIPLYSALFGFLLVFPACRDSDLQQVAKSLVVVAQAVGTVQETAIEANKQGLLGVDDTAAVLDVCIRVSEAGREATAIAKSINALDQASRQRLLAVWQPIVAAVGKSPLLSQLAARAGPTAERLRASFTLLQTTVNSIQLVLASGGR